jgi:hypothetical protein
MKETDDHVHFTVHLKGDRREGAMAAVQGAQATASRELSHGGRCAGAVPDVLRDGGGGTAIYEDLVDLFEQSAANLTPIREIVGKDPVEFIEVFVQNYPKGQWIIRERERLTNAIERAAGEDTGREAGAV